jgi:alpha-1,2-glucosyltransferase
MLYIWPYFVFFSWPLVLPQFLRISAGILSNFSSVLYSRLPAGYKTPAPRIGTTIAFTLLALAVVHVNTIVHPFMLADNRHYTFYIFKRLLRPWWMRYAVTPLYVVCGWACIEMQGPVADANEDNKVTTPKRSTKRPENAENSSTAQVMSLPDGLRPATTSFVLIWLLTTTIQLSTAPLFEPRYLIIPWLFWRIHLPLQSSPTLPPPATSTTTSPSNKSKIKLKADPGFLQAIFAAYDFRLVVETLWYLLINAVTGYIFVTWTFEWPLQPGEKQRFMW